MILHAIGRYHPREVHRAIPYLCVSIHSYATFDLPRSIDVHRYRFGAKGK